MAHAWRFGRRLARRRNGGAICAEHSTRRLQRKSRAAVRPGKDQRRPARGFCAVRSRPQPPRCRGCAPARTGKRFRWHHIRSAHARPPGVVSSAAGRALAGDAQASDATRIPAYSGAGARRRANVAVHRGRHRRAPRRAAPYATAGTPAERGRNPWAWRPVGACESRGSRCARRSRSVAPRPSFCTRLPTRTRARSSSTAAPATASPSPRR